MNRPLLRAVFAGTLVLIAAKGYCRTQVNVSSAQRPEVYQPVADPAAVVTLEHARFTVLTPQLIRMEWAADSKFEDHASFAFLNRRLPVPPVPLACRRTRNTTRSYLVCFRAKAGA
jgi:hypothetical protein